MFFIISRKDEHWDSAPSFPRRARTASQRRSDDDSARTPIHAAGRRTGRAHRNIHAQSRSQHLCGLPTWIQAPARASLPVQLLKTLTPPPSHRLSVFKLLLVRAPGPPGIHSHSQLPEGPVSCSAHPSAHLFTCPGTLDLAVSGPRILAPFVSVQGHISARTWTATHTVTLPATWRTRILLTAPSARLFTCPGTLDLAVSEPRIIAPFVSVPAAISARTWTRTHTVTLPTTRRTRIQLTAPSARLFTWPGTLEFGHITSANQLVFKLLQWLKCCINCIN